ncbi:MAG TPA: hypothetical protein VGN16_03955 [Acidobacteriaceae bacterium]|jgi:hypothetical protein
MSTGQWFIFILGAIYVVSKAGMWLNQQFWIAHLAEMERERAERHKVAAQLVNEYRRAEFERARSQENT